MQEKRFGYDISMLENQHAIFTASEIYQQPDVWLKVCDQLCEQKERIENFINQALNEKELQIILTGAGTSAFAGEVVEPVLNKTVPHTVRAIATTDIVANPLSYLSPDKPTLLISYARSGNSPESVAAVELANQLVKNIYHIVITCNEKGALAKMSHTDEKTLLLLMPPETNDKSFAMTSSCTSMILTNLIIFNLENIGRIRTEV
ncbi:MAG: SIS domain-containing protein [Turicibacter sp.]